MTLHLSWTIMENGVIDSDGADREVWLEMGWCWRVESEGVEGGGEVTDTSPNWTKGCPQSCRTLVLVVSVRVSLEEPSIWSGKLSKDSPLPVWWGLNWTHRWRNGEFLLVHLFLLSDIRGSGSWASDLTTRDAPLHTPSQAFGPGLNFTISPPSSPAFRQQTVGLLGLHNQLSQFPW